MSTSNPLSPYRVPTPIFSRPALDCSFIALQLAKGGIVRATDRSQASIMRNAAKRNGIRAVIQREPDGKWLIKRQKASPYFHAQFRDFLTRIIDARPGWSAAFQIKHNGGCCLKTLQNALAGRGNHAATIVRLTSTTFDLPVCSRVELWIRFAERKLGQYLLGVGYPKKGALVGLNLTEFFNRRGVSPLTPQARLTRFFDNALKGGRGQGAKGLCGFSELDQLDLPYSTVTAVLRGDSVKCATFEAVSNRLAVTTRTVESRDDWLTCARLLHVERMFGATLLGDDESPYYHPPSDLPRLGRLLEFSQQHAWHLA